MEVVSKPTTGEGAAGSGDGPGGVMASPSLSRLTRGSASPQRVSAQRDVYVSQARRALAHAFPPTSAPLQPATPCTPACNSVQPHATRPLALQPATACMQPRNRPQPHACSPPTAHTRAGIAPAPVPCSRDRTQPRTPSSMTPRTKTLYAFGDTPAAKLQTINLQLNRTPGSDAGAMHVLHQMRSSGNSPAPQPAAAGQSPSEEEVSEPGGRKRSLNLSQDPTSNGGGCASRLRAPRAPRLGTRPSSAAPPPRGRACWPGAARHPWPSRHCLPWPSRHCLRWPSRHCLRCPSRPPLQPPTPLLPLAPAGVACDADSSRSEAPRPSAPIARPRARPPTWATTRADAHLASCRGGRDPTRC